MNKMLSGFKKNGSLGLMVVMTLVSASVQAGTGAAGASAGMAKATSTAQAIQTGLFTFVGVAAVIYMIYLALMAFTEKKTWSDFGYGVLHVALAGGAVALASWAWTMFQ